METKKHFTIKEMCNSDTAYRLGINNTPTSEIKEHLHELIDFLEPIRIAWRSPIHVNSGYRCEKLNKAVGGVSTSSHLYGYAADLYPSNGRFESFCSFVLEFLQDNKMPFDEYIIEKAGNSQWLHLSVKSKDGLQRKKILKITK